MAKGTYKRMSLFGLTVSEEESMTIMVGSRQIGKQADRQVGRQAGMDLE